MEKAVKTEKAIMTHTFLSPALYSHRFCVFYLQMLNGHFLSSGFEPLQAEYFQN